MRAVIGFLLLIGVGLFFYGLRTGAVTFGLLSPRVTCAKVCAPERVAHVLIRVDGSGDVQGFDCECQN